MTNSLTTALEELRTKNDFLNIDNTQLRTDIATMKDEIRQLKTENDMMKAKIFHTHHVDTSRSLHPPPVPPRGHKLKVGQWSEIT